MNQTFRLSTFVLGVVVASQIFLGCAQPHEPSSAMEAGDYDVRVDESALTRAREILEKYPNVPEDDRSTAPVKDEVDEVIVENDLPSLPPETSSTSTENPEAVVVESEFDSDNQSVGNPIPPNEVVELLDFVDEATIEILSDTSESQRSKPEVHRFCKGDGIVAKTKLYSENVKDECLLPKMKVASNLFSIRYSFVRCIFEQENRSRDRLAHNNNGNGLAQITNTTMREINKRWKREDSASLLFKRCLQYTSNRHDHYLNPIEKLLVPSEYNKSDIFREAAHRPPSTRVNPLYRDDSVCLGLLTMAIKVQEAKSRKNQGKIPDHELARRYNGSKNQQKYARDIVRCVERYKHGAQPAKGKKGTNGSKSTKLAQK
jgi:hypothetical protein